MTALKLQGAAIDHRNALSLSPYSTYTNAES